MGARMRLLALALAILMVVSTCLAANRKVIKVDVLKHEDTIVHGRRLLDDGDDIEAGYPGSSVDNHHQIPRQDYEKCAGPKQNYEKCVGGGGNRSR